VLALLSQRLGYTYLGDWIDRPANSKIEPERLKAWLASQGESDTLAARALFELQKAARGIRLNRCAPTFSRPCAPPPASRASRSGAT
jgi:hypothetical protein